MRKFLIGAFLFYSGTVAAMQSDLPLDQAARRGDLFEVKRLLDKGKNPNELNKWGSSALVGASTYKADSALHTEIVRYLIAHGADVNQRVTDGTTALNEAAFWGHAETVRVLLAAKTNVNLPKDNGFTPLLSAASKGHILIVKLLIAAGADLNRQTRNGGLTALHLASGAGYKEMVTVLLAAGARADIKSSRGETYRDVYGRTAGISFP